MRSQPSTYKLLSALVLAIALTACKGGRGVGEPNPPGDEGDRRSDTGEQARPNNDGGVAGDRGEEAHVKIRLILDQEALEATLEDNAAARDFLALLPVTLSFRDYASTEKISDLPARLSTTGAPPGVVPSAGDIAYYAPWGNVAIYYRDFGYSSGLVRLGHIDGGIEKLASQRGDFMMRFERAD